MNLVKINCSGIKFEVSKDTISLIPDNFLYNLVFNKNFKKNEEYFIDRDPDLFKIILKFFRNNTLYSNYVTEEILDEFDYYNIDIYQKIDLKQLKIGTKKQTKDESDIFQMNVSGDNIFTVKGKLLVYKEICDNTPVSNIKFQILLNDYFKDYMNFLFNEIKNESNLYLKNFIFGNFLKVKGEEKFKKYENQDSIIKIKITNIWIYKEYSGITLKILEVYPIQNKKI